MMVVMMMIERGFPSSLCYQRETLNKLLPQAVSVVYECGGGGTGRVESRELPQDRERGFVSFWSRPSSGIEQGPRGSWLQQEPNRDTESRSAAGSDVEDKDTLVISVDQRSKGPCGMFWAKRDYPPPAQNISHHSGAGVPQ